MGLDFDVALSLFVFLVTIPCGPVIRDIVTMFLRFCKAY